MGMSFIFLLISFNYIARRYHRPIPTKLFGRSFNVHLAWLRAVGPLTVIVISIALMNIFE